MVKKTPVRRCGKKYRPKDYLLKYLREHDGQFEHYLKRSEERHSETTLRKADVHIRSVLLLWEDRNSLASIATRYGMDGPEIESW